MAPTEALVKQLDKKCEHNIVKFVSEIRNGKLEGSNKIASATVTLLEQIISDSQNATAFELVTLLRETGRRLSLALPQCGPLVCGNMVRRVLRAVRDEHRATAAQSGTTPAGESGGESLQRLVQAAPTRRATLGAAQQDLREPLRDHIAELRLELESSTSSICSTAGEHIHADELILSAGHGALLQRFLQTCIQRRYRLLLADTAKHEDCNETHLLAARLSAAGVDVTVISNASVYAVMSRVNKVVLGVEAALAGGAVLAGAGVRAISLAAKHYSVPVVFLAPLYQLSPLHGCEPTNFTALDAPQIALHYQNETASMAHVFAPKYDYIPPDHVTLFITNLGGSSPSYIYRLLSELYDPQDYQL